jgi:hypothetical protein
MVSVSARQPLGGLVMQLLDPESDDGFATWNAFDALLAVGRPYPVLRLPVPEPRVR